MLPLYNTLADRRDSVVITQVPGAIACLDIAHIMTTVQRVAKVHQHGKQVIDHRRVMPMEVMVGYMLLLLVTVALVLFVMLMRHVRGQVQLKTEVHLLAYLVTATKEVKALEMHCQNVWCFIYADTLVGSHLQMLCKRQGGLDITIRVNHAAVCMPANTIHTRHLCALPRWTMTNLLDAVNLMAAS